MTREQKIKRAAELLAKGLTYTEIGEHFGYAWPKSGGYKLCHPDKAKEYTRRTAARPETKARKREWNRTIGRGVCVECGGPKGIGSKHNRSRCRLCEDARRHAAATKRYERIAEMWSAGKTLAEIADALDTNVNSLGATMALMRDAGWDLPYRTPTYPSGQPKHPDLARAA